MLTHIVTFSRHLKSVFFILFCLIPALSFAQLDNEFWFAAPPLSPSHGGGYGQPIYFQVTADSVPVKITISLPSTGVVLTSFSLQPYKNKQVRVFPSGLFTDIADLENYYSDGVQNKGLLLESDGGLFTAYYEYANTYNRDIYSLKGNNALGTEFWVSTQNSYKNGYDDAGNGFVIVATEDSTEVTVDLTGSSVDTYSGVVTIMLNKGQTYTFQSNSVLAEDHLNGIHVTSNKNIAISIYDDSIYHSGAKDVIGDQYIPITKIGTEYFALKGNVSGSGEFLFITATKDNTAITVNGTYLKDLDQGDVYTVPVDQYAMSVSATFPIYVNQISTCGTEPGGAVLPPINQCIGSLSVTYRNSSNKDSKRFVNLYLRVAKAKTDAERSKMISGFTVYQYDDNSNLLKTIVLPSSDFEFTNDNTYAYIKNTSRFYNILTKRSTVVRVTNDYKFHLAITEGTSGGNRFGYFSDFSEMVPSAVVFEGLSDADGDFCQGAGEIVMLAYNGIIVDWLSVGNPNDIDLLYDKTPTSAKFNSDTIGYYSFLAIVENDCSDGEMDTLAVSINISPSYDILDTVWVCENDLPYTYRDTVFNIGTVDSIYNFERLSVSGCDSITHLRLIICLAYEMKDSSIICSS